MKLICIIELQSLINNVKISARHVRGISNEIADFLSRDKLAEFQLLAKQRNMIFDKFETPIPSEIWPVEKIWFD